MTTSVPAIPPATPRLAATMVLVRDHPFEVLLVRRHAKAVFASTLVFPGGAVDPDDYSDDWMPLIGSGADLPASERAVRIAGLRETFEETGLLLATLADGSAVAQPEPAATSFRAALAASGGLLMLADAHPYAHWITPEIAPRRFDTYFLLARAPHGQEPLADGNETIDLEWVSPAATVQRATHDAKSIIFPTLLNLMRLAESADTTTAIAAAQNRPLFTVMPTVESREGGARMAVIPEEAGYGITEHPAPELGS